MIRFNIDFRDKQCLSHLFLSLASKKKNLTKTEVVFVKQIYLFLPSFTKYVHFKSCKTYIIQDETSHVLNIQWNAKSYCWYVYYKVVCVEKVMIIKTRHWVWRTLDETIGQCLGVMSSGVETPGFSSNEKRLANK